MLTGWIAAVIGIIIVVFSLNRLISEIRKGGIPNMEDQSFSDTFYTLLNRVETQGENLDDINQTFYETVERLEKRIETLEKKPSAAELPTKPRWDFVPDTPSPRFNVTESGGIPSEQVQKLPEEAYMAAQIRKLLNEGKDSQQVARELNLGVGEVELIRRLNTGQQNPKSTGGKNHRQDV